MKKIYFLMMATLMGMFSLTSCDGLNINGDDIVDDLLGEATLIITHSDSEVADTMNFTTSIIDVFKEPDTTASPRRASVCINAKVDINTADLDFPFLYFRLDDTTTSVYQMDTILTLPLLMNLNFDTIVSLLADPYGGNMLLVAEGEDAWYMSFDGSVTVSEFPGIGHIVKGTFNNVRAFYVTQSAIEQLNTDINNMDFSHANDFEYYFPIVTFSGDFSSRRTSIVQSVMNEAFSQGGISSK